MTSLPKTKKRVTSSRKPPLFFYNTLTRRLEPFVPLRNGEVSFYSCGPTVYDFAHIGNFRTNITVDTIRRIFEYAGYRVTHVMNITDVGHLTSDADTGEDKLEVGAKREKKSAWDIAEFYTKAFLQDLDRLNILRPHKMPRATDHIKEMIELISTLEKNGFIYRIEDGLYFDTSKLSAYGRLARKAGLKAGARVEMVKGKKNLTDFALWKFSTAGEKRQMEWDSPWGRGFPGWHIECSAMSMKYLGETFDVHSGGEDLIPIHHENEIAQSEAATGKPFVRYWIHGYFMLVDGEKMSKSKGNLYTVQDLINRGFDPLAYRYLCLQAHYRTQMNFTWESLEAAQRALAAIRALGARDTNPLPNDRVRKEVETAFYHDLDTPRALALLHEANSFALWKHFDSVLGLGLVTESVTITNDQQDLVDRREHARRQEKFQEADRLRDELEKQGIFIEDTPAGPRLVKRQG